MPLAVSHLSPALRALQSASRVHLQKPLVVSQVLAVPPSAALQSAALVQRSAQSEGSLGFGKNGAQTWLPLQPPSAGMHWAMQAVTLLPKS